MHTEQTVNAWKTFRGAISKAAPEGQEYVETVESLAVARAQVGDAKGAAKALAALAEACAAACSGAMVKARNVLWAKAPRHAVQLADAVLAQRHTITAWTVDATFTRAAAARWQAEKDADDSSSAAAATTPRVVDADEMLDNALERFPAVGALLALGKHVVQGSLTEAGAHDDENALAPHGARAMSLAYVRRRIVVIATATWTPTTTWTPTATWTPTRTTLRRLEKRMEKHLGAKRMMKRPLQAS